MIPWPFEGFPVDAHGRAPLPQQLDGPTPGRVLILAPHPDDDVIGMGGSAALHVEQGDDVHVIVVYSGLSGDPEQRWDPSEYGPMRQREARAGGAHLGLSSYEFWDYPEGHSPAPYEVLKAAVHLGECIQKLAPDVVYCPWIGEHHLDHHVLARVTRLALARIKFAGTAWGYEVWSPLIPTHVINIDSVFERKVTALREHKTQLDYVDIVHKGLAVNGQRSIYVAGDCRQAEGLAPLGGPEPEDLALLDTPFVPPQ
ncbi:MAG: LmbE family N-acetylglucosaminyl deacetylase [Gammaproteobacteria bacterium]